MAQGESPVHHEPNHLTNPTCPTSPVCLTCPSPYHHSKLITYLKGTSLKFATFILMLSHIASDCREFAFVLFCFISMFAVGS